MVIEKLPQKEILQFRSSSAFGIDRLAAYYGGCTLDICEYSLGIKLMSESTYHYAFSEVAGCLICRDEYDGLIYFDYPIAGEGGDVEAALEAIERYCLETDTPLRFTTLPESVLGALMSRYDGVRVRQTYYCGDYFYRTEDVRAFVGKKYAGQRNHIRRFYREHPTACFRKLTREDLPALKKFASRFAATFQKQGSEALTEREAAFSIIRENPTSLFRIGCMEIDGEIVGVALGEKCGNTLVEHIEKALAAEYEGVYPALFQAFVTMFGADCAYVNREDDAADRGLRTSKMQYHPAHISKKFDVDVENILYTLREIPTLQTERLTLDSITLGDADDYGRLCTDDVRNRYWGYDYREDFPDGTPSGETFCLDIARDFEEHYAINFAIRLNGRLIGEVIVYHFDNRGGAEIGVRIASAHAGHGFGREAVAAVSDWALYRLGVSKLVAQCFRQNLASERMLSSLMRRVGDDGTMISFERTV
jgi:hypothetical protein